ncbi:MAG: hypothetical protein H7Y31_11175 [Chitinophagaceae bacterium]|nr:hypothetical protein [Chitinophagaceae bacterium]
MKQRIFFLFLLINSSNVSAQDSTLVRIQSGSRIRDVLTTSEIFSQPEFKMGKVFFRSGVVSAARMNYNSLDDQMLFIDTRGDTLALKNEKTIKFISLDKDTFYYIDGYVRLVASNSVVKLVEKKVWEVADIRKIGSHNRPATTYAVTSFRTATDGFGRTYDLVMDEDVWLRKKATYYFGNMYNNFVPAGRKHLLSLFPKNETMLARYLNESKIDFKKMHDLGKLLDYLSQHQ